MTRVIEEVIAAEKEAEKLLKRAEERKLDIAAKAKQDALARITEQQKMIDAGQQAMVKKRVEELERKKEKIRTEGHAKITQTERAAQGNIAKARDYLLEQFEAYID